MKIKSEFILRKTAGTWIAMAITPEYDDVEGVLTLNETGALLWEALVPGCEIEDLVSVLTKEYEIDAEQAREDINAFIEKLRRFNCLI